MVVQVNLDIGISSVRQMKPETYPHVIFNGEEDMILFIVLLEKLRRRLGTLFSKIVCMDKARRSGRIDNVSVCLKHCVVFVVEVIESNE